MEKTRAAFWKTAAVVVAMMMAKFSVLFVLLLMLSCSANYAMLLEEVGDDAAGPGSWMDG